MYIFHPVCLILVLPKFFRSSPFASQIVETADTATPPLHMFLHLSQETSIIFFPRQLSSISACSSPVIVAAFSYALNPPPHVGGNELANNP